MLYNFVGVYKPRVRCYDVAQMSMKFERCMDSEVIRFLLLVDDYTKVAFFICHYLLPLVWYIVVYCIFHLTLSFKLSFKLVLCLIIINMQK